MSEYFHAGQRQLQDEFDTRRLADRLQAGIIQAVITPPDAEFIEAQNMFFLATVDDKGQANCSYKGGDKGLVKVVDETTLAFPIYDGNGMFMSAGNVLVNGEVGLLFIDFARQARVRVNGIASITPQDPLLSNWPEARLVVRVKVRETFPNCPRYIHKMDLVETSGFVPKEQCETPAAPWKKLEIVADVLPSYDAHLASNEQDVLAAINRN
ncbi:MAG TPA: pyridoxamine 5'-phosphate oxidase family protein [Methylophilaceae bacterium]|nr:pyridoxamine 5'-phosphate oxidase family protein [Methylophilaceae bacterium]